MLNLEQAIQFSLNTHKGEFRKCGVLPYAVHPIEVMKKVYSWGFDDINMLFAALGHDFIESYIDTGKESEVPSLKENIKINFGETALSYIEDLTLVPNSISKEEYMNSFSTKCREVLVVKLADRYCNIMDFQSSNPKYAIKYTKKAKPLFDTFFAREKEIQNWMVYNDIFNLAKHIE